jgi:hypothetical protein
MTSLYRDPSFPLDPLCVPCQIERDPGAARRVEWRSGMLDVIMLAIGVGGFALLAAYGALCARL